MKNAMNRLPNAKTHKFSWKTTLRLVLIFLALNLLAKNAKAQETDVIAEVQEMLDEYTWNIKTDKELIAGGLKDESSLALDFLNRGKVYWGYAKKYKLADQDFTTALGYFQTTRQQDDWLYRLRHFEAWHYRAICRKELGNFSDAEADACHAVDGFAELVSEGHHYCASMQVYALKIRAEIRTHEAASLEWLEAAISDYELACVVSKSIAEKEPERTAFFEEQDDEFKKLQGKVQERVQRLSGDADSNKSKNNSR